MWKNSLIVATIFGAVVAGGPNYAKAQQLWVEPQNTTEALLEPDKYAWRLFVALSWPALVAQKTADSSKAFGDPAPGPIVWETWRNARNSAPDATFKKDGSDPGPWLDATPDLANVESRFDTSALQQQIFRDNLEKQNLPLPAFDQIAANLSINETRLNKKTYQFVRQNDLYNLEGQVALFNGNKKTVFFPPMAKEVKAQWREIENNAQTKARYHWVQGDDGKMYGLTALHITTKDLPNWFWATFEHIDNKLSASMGGRPGNEGWLLPSKDTFACGARNLPDNCDKAPPEFEGISIDGTKWEHFVLRGTQIDFIDSRGSTTLLANSQPEQGFQLTSSCITCHARATIGSGGSRLDIFKPDGQGDVGSPNPDWFVETNGNLKFTQLDFVWSFIRACAKNPPRDPKFCEQ